MLDISLTSCKIHGMAGRRPPTLSAKESLILELLVRDSLSARIPGDDRAARRMIGWAVSVTVALTALLEIPFLNLPAPLSMHVSDVDSAKLLLYLIPHGLTIAVPIGS
jgi:hypothetical protein